MNYFAKFQSKVNAFFLNDVGGLNTIETTVIIIAVMFVIGVVFTLVVKKLLPAERNIGNGVNGIQKKVLSDADISLYNVSQY